MLVADQCWVMRRPASERDIYLLPGAVQCGGRAMRFAPGAAGGFAEDARAPAIWRKQADGETGERALGGAATKAQG